MGRSTNAYIYYGFDVYDAEEGLIKYCKKEANPDNLLAELFYQNGHSERYVEELMGVSVGTHCSGDFPIYYIYVTESQEFATRGFPEVVTQWPVDKIISFRDTLKNACEALNIDYNEEEDFKFRIASYES